MGMGIVPLHGYFDQDFLGLVMLTLSDQKIGEVAESLAGWVVDLRVDRTGELEVVYKGKVLDSNMTVEEAGIEPFERIDVRQI